MDVFNIAWLAWRMGSQDLSESVGFHNHRDRVSLQDRLWDPFLTRGEPALTTGSNFGNDPLRGEGPPTEISGKKQNRCFWTTLLGKKIRGILFGGLSSRNVLSATKKAIRFRGANGATSFLTGGWEVPPKKWWRF